MFMGYTYEIRKSNKIIGYKTLIEPVRGLFLVIPAESIFKQKYGRRYEHIKIPIGYEIKDDGVTVSTTRFLDVSRKSQRQIDLILGKKRY